MLIITHDRDLAASLPRRIALRDGRVVAPMTSRLLPADLLRVGAVGPAHAAAAGRALRARDRDRHREHGRGARAVGLVARRAARAARPPGNQPAHRGAGADARRRRRDAARERRADAAARWAAWSASTRCARWSATVRRSDRIDPEETGGIAVDAADPGLLADPGRIDGPRALPQRRDRRARGRSSWARRRRRRWASTARARWSTSPGAGGPCWASWPRSSSRPSSTAPRSWATTPRSASSAPSDRRAPCTCAPTRRSSRACTTCVPSAANPEHPEEVDVSRPSDALAARAAGRRRADRRCSSASAPWRCSSAASGSPTRWSSRSSSAARRSACAARWAPPARPRARAVPRRVAAAGGRRRAGRDRRRRRSSPGPTRARAAGRRSCRPRRSPAALGAALAIGAVAGLYPAGRAARMSPTEALRGA